MDVNALRARLLDLRKSLTNGQLAMIGALGVIAFVMVFWLYGWVSKPSYRVLATGQTAESTKQIVDQLDKDGVSYKLSNGGTTVEVKESDFDKAKLGVSGVTGSATIAGLELFDKQGFTTSEFQQRVDYQRALQGELTRAILKFQGVTSANVTLAIPTERVFSKDQQPTRASVLVGTTSAANGSTVQSIVELVSAAVPGLDASNVTVTDTRGRVLSSGGAGASIEDKRAQMTADYEMALAAKAESMLAAVYGPGKISVRVNADLDFDTKTTEQTTYEADSAIPVRKSSSEETFTGSGSPPGGTVGVEGSTGGSGTAGDNSYSKKDASEENVVASKVEKSTTAPGAVKRLTAAAVFDDKIDPAPDADKVKSLIAAAIGADEETRKDVVEVQAVTYNEKIAKQLDDAIGATAPAAPSPLLNYVRTGVGILVLVLVLLFLKKSLKTTSEPVAVPGTIDLAAAERARARATADSVYDVDLDRGLPGELRLLDSEPDALANTLREWVADRREVSRDANAREVVR